MTRTGVHYWGGHDLVPETRSAMSPTASNVLTYRGNPISIASGSQRGYRPPGMTEAKVPSSGADWQAASRAPRVDGPLGLADEVAQFSARGS
jgi:hypothetical protein